MKKLIGFVILLAAAGGGWWYYIKYGKPPEKATVNYAAVSEGTILESVTSTGTLEPERRFDVGSQVSGTVQKIYVDYNDIVKEGQLLAEIDPSLLQTQVQIRQAAIARQESDIANQQVQLEDQKRQLDRTRNLAEKGLQNQQQLEAAELAVKTRVAQIESAKKSLVQAQADLTQAEMNVSYTKIKAPADGVVVERRVDVGQTVQASMTTPSFFVLSKPLDNLRLTALVDEADIGRIRPDMEVRFTVEAYGQQSFTGYVNSVRLNASVNNNVVTYPVWISVPNRDLRLRPSMTASLRIIISTAESVTRIPNAATRFRPNADIYKALGKEPPAPGSGGRLSGPQNEDARNNSGRGNRQEGQNAQGGNRAGGQGAQANQGANQGGNRQPGGQNAQSNQGGGNRQPGMQGGQTRGQGGQGGQNAQNGGQRAPGGRGFGGNQDFANMTPEQRQAAMERFRAMGGGRGAGGSRGGNQMQGGGRGQGAGNRGQQPPPADQEDSAQRNASKIDELWAPIRKTDTPGSVWTWNEATKELKEYKIRLGVTDGNFTELVSGDLKVGDQLVTSVILPLSMRATTPGANPLLGGQQRGMPGMGGPGGMGGGGNPGGGGGGNPGGGGRGGGGGGGGRGGGN